MSGYYLIVLQALVILSREALNLSNGWWVPLQTNTDRTILNYLCHFTVFLCVYLVNYLKVAPCLLRKNYKRYFIYLAGISVISNAVLLSADYLFYESPFPYQKHIFYAGFNVTFYLFTSTSFSFTTNWQMVVERKRSLLNENKTAELQLLRSQVNPHFLFNILNSIYALSLKKSGNTINALEKLNSVLKYMTESSPKEMIRLQQEINYLKDIIELQKLRMRYPENLIFIMEVSNYNVSIPPLLLLPLVENCFKHGNISGKSSLINLILKQSEKELFFFAENEFRQSPEETGGIGLENLKQRLSILYPSSHSFQTNEAGNKFSAELKLLFTR